MPLWLIPLLVLALLHNESPVAVAQEARAGTELTLESIFESGELRPRGAATGSWLPDGSGYLRIERAGGELVIRDPETGTIRKRLVTRAELVRNGAPDSVLIRSFQHSDDASVFLLGTTSGWWVIGQSDVTPRRLRSGLGHTFFRPRLSPRGDRVAYLFRRDLYQIEIGTGRVSRLTHDGTETTVNGNRNGVYLGLSQAGFYWSPNGEYIAFVQFNTEGTSTFQLINNIDSVYPTVRSIPYVKPGGHLPAARIGIVDVAGERSVWVKLPGSSRDHYLRDLQWSPGSDGLMVQQLIRPGQTVSLFRADPGSGAVTEILTEQDDTWLDPRPIHWLAGGKSFLWLSERSGWRRAYVVPASGGEPRPVTPPDLDLLEVDYLDEGAGYIYFTASPGEAIRNALYRTRLDGSGVLERVTPENDRGSHDYVIAPNGRWAWHRRSSIDSPPVTSLVSLPDHQVVRILTDNGVLRSRLGELNLSPTEFFQVDIGNGVELDGWLIRPREFDPNQRYPVIVHVYGMPASTRVNDRWAGARHLFHHLLAQRGYIVMSLDNRGTPAPKGRAWRRSIYLRHGVLPAAEQALAIEALEERWPWIDPARTAIYGWSGGGNVALNAILRHPETFEVAMAGAALSDHRLYNAGFTERFLGLPAENPEAYDLTAPVRFAKDLEGRLLLIHGTADPNVHAQNAELLADALIRAGKRFTYMPYPNRVHGIRERVHLHDLYLSFLEANLPPGPVPMAVETAGTDASP